LFKNIILAIILRLNTIYLVNVLDQEWTPQDVTLITFFQLVIDIIETPLHAIGVFGAVKEHYKLNMTYGIINLIYLLITMFLSIISMTLFYWEIFFYVVVAVTAITLANEIKRAKEANLKDIIIK